jgi:predicted AAA+ superfamily ATPase
LFDNTGNLTSAKKIADTMTSSGVKISSHTVTAWLHALTDSYLIYPVQRFDVKGKRYLQNINKYYLVDTGLRFALLGERNPDYGRMLENVIYLELLRRSGRGSGNAIYIGKSGPAEIDFVVEYPDGFDYIQVAQTVRDSTTFERELAPLQNVRDYRNRIVLTQDEDPSATYNGIQVRNAIDWLQAN